MKARIIENVEELNKCLSENKPKRIEWKSFIVGERMEKGGKVYIVVDRFLVFEK